MCADGNDYYSQSAFPESTTQENRKYKTRHKKTRVLLRIPPSKLLTFSRLPPMLNAPPCLVLLRAAVAGSSLLMNESALATLRCCLTLLLRATHSATSLSMPVRKPIITPRFTPLLYTPALLDSHCDQLVHASKQVIGQPGDVIVSEEAVRAEW